MSGFGLAYDICLHLYAFGSLPKILTKFSKYRDGLGERLGFRFPTITKNGKKLIWIHAVSLGETKAVAPLIKKFKALNDPPLILLSTSTATGYAEGTKTPADFQAYLPFDFSYVIRPIVHRIAPDVVILTETDFWYHFQQAAKESGAQLAVINGKISKRSFERLGKLPFLAHRLFSPIDHFYLQGEGYRNRFASLNIPSSKLSVTGNIKLDTPLEKDDIARLKQIFGVQDELVLTLGSTHAPEEKIWIQAIKKLNHPQLKTLIVPRHPERFNEVAKLLTQENVSFTRYSEGGTHTQPFVLVDAMGVLKKCYQISDLAFVGGSFTPKVGGHNILEPSLYGKPVLFGPHMHSQPDLLDLARIYQSGLQITEESLIPTLESLISDPSKMQKIGENGLKLMEESRGALDHTFTSLLSLLQNKPS